MRAFNPELLPFLTDERMRLVASKICHKYMTPQTVPLVEVWLSGEFMAQLFEPRDGAQRVTVSRPQRGNDGDWVAEIAWDDLQRVKREIGRGDRWAVEAYPAERDIVNVANMRHLWLLEERPSWGWESEVVR